MILCWHAFASPILRFLAIERASEQGADRCHDVLTTSVGVHVGVRVVVAFVLYIYIYILSLEKKSRTFYDFERSEARALSDLI